MRPERSTGMRFPAARPALRCVADVGAMPEDLKGSVMLLGNFDGFHLGHRMLLAAAKEHALLSGRPIGVMSVEPHPKQFFAPQCAPFRLSTLATKKEIFARLGVDFIYGPRFDRTFAGQEAEQFVETVLAQGLAVSRVVVGPNFRFGRERRGDVELLRRLGERHGFELTCVGEFTQAGAACSSTRVRERLAKGDIGAANVLLGRAWSVEIDRLPKTGQGEISWPEAVLQPACGSYVVALRRANDARVLSFGRLTISEAGPVRLALNGPAGAEETPLFLDFLARA
ncbi:hypothetical protein [Mesorhizobium sp. SP-1A]|uniref:hypothetical protein n=1 Tax=Mesorhizobium sp. SP-1A TaxID=3077840 RepID=UPI0028F74834|nr:hypothetical protein [Mesorhizobium sp. SP-1A]